MLGTSSPKETMLFFIVRRFIYMLILLLVMSIVAFFLIQLPPGDYVTTLISSLQRSGRTMDELQIASLRRQYGLDLPVYLRYFKWMWGVLHLNFGMSAKWQKPVTEIIGDRLLFTLGINFLTIILTFAIAIPVGIYSATHQYSPADYTFTVIGFAGLATPNFLFALVLMVFLYKYFDLNVVGLFSREYANAVWSTGKIIDMLKHLPIPIIVIGTAGTAGIIRIMRGCLLDELRKQYVITARAKGVSERTLLFKYPVRVAINPIVSTIGWLLPATISAGTITAIVLVLPTIGPLFLQSLMNQDTYLAGSMIMLLGFLTIVGTFVSDLLLVWIDPRIGYE